VTKFGQAKRKCALALSRQKPAGLLADRRA
jgi:hypothetical protein